MDKKIHLYIDYLADLLGGYVHLGLSFFIFVLAIVGMVFLFLGASKIVILVLLLTMFLLSLFAVIWIKK